MYESRLHDSHWNKVHCKHMVMDMVGPTSSYAWGDSSSLSRSQLESCDYCLTCWIHSMIGCPKTVRSRSFFILRHVGCSLVDYKMIYWQWRWLDIRINNDIKIRHTVMVELYKLQLNCQYRKAFINVRSLAGGRWDGRYFTFGCRGPVITRTTSAVFSHWPFLILKNLRCILMHHKTTLRQVVA